MGFLCSRFIQVTWTDQLTEITPHLRTYFYVIWVPWEYLYDCNGNNINAKRATGFAIIKNGGVVDIKLTEKGTHYYKEPKVYIRGLGRGARARAVLKEGSVSDIIILSGGKNYNSTPTVIFEKPNIMVHCNLCCKTEL